MSRTILDEIQKKLNIYLDTAEGLPELIKLLNHFFTYTDLQELHWIKLILENHPKEISITMEKLK